MVNFMPIGGASNENTSAAAAAATKKPAVAQDQFLQLLVAQIRNQNPLEPANGVEFLSQLAQFSQLEQTIGVKDEVNGLRTQVDSIIAAMPKATPTTTDSEKTGEGNV